MNEDKNPTPASLRECPFCGGAVKAQHIEDDGEWIGLQFSCKKCDYAIMREGLFEEKDMAWWNGRTRPEPPAVRCAGNEDVREKVGRYLQAMDDGLSTATCKERREALRAALSAPVPQPPAGNEEPASMEAGSADAAEAVFHWAWVWRKKPSPETCADLVKACRNFIGDTQPAPATGTDCKECGGAGVYEVYQGPDNAPAHPDCPACNGTGKATACPNNAWGCDYGCSIESEMRPNGRTFINPNPACPVHGHGKREGDR